jgi:hypothetical protein
MPVEEPSTDHKRKCLWLSLQFLTSDSSSQTTFAKAFTTPSDKQECDKSRRRFDAAAHPTAAPDILISGHADLKYLGGLFASRVNDS